MRQTTTFEGFFDEEPGWEFDMPVYMLHPVHAYTDSAGSGAGGVDELIDNYMINEVLKKEGFGPTGIGGGGIDEDDIRSARIQFAYAKKGKARSGVFYWRRVIEWDDEDDGFLNILEDIHFNREAKEEA